MLVSNELATDEALRLSRTTGFPVPSEQPEAFSGLVAGLVNAANRSGVDPSAIVTECLQLSPHCPTDFDLLRAAEALRESLRQGWKPPPERVCPLCGGSGWREAFALHTREATGSGGAFTRKEPITREVYESLKGKLDDQKQVVYSGSKRCSCRRESSAA